MLNRLSLRAKLALVAIVPIVVMLALGINGAWLKYVDLQKREQAQSLSNLVIALGEVVHELQKERGMSAGFINSKGSKFADNLRTQSKLTDEKASHLFQGIGSIDASFVGPRYIKLLETAREPLAKLGEKREQISRLTLTPAESLSFYSDLIAHLLEVAVRTGTRCLPLCSPDSRTRNRPCFT